MPRGHGRLISRLDVMFMRFWLGGGGSSSEGEGGNGDWEEGEEWGGWCEDERFLALDGVE